MILLTSKEYKSYLNQKASYADDDMLMMKKISQS